MASKFSIHIQRPDDPGKPVRVRVEDHDQEDLTPWQSIPQRWRNEDEDTLLALARMRSPRISDMLDTARRIAYAVWMGEEHLDIHDFLARADTLAEQAVAKHQERQLQSRTRPAAARRVQGKPRL